jgi:lipopolysaccharide export LptBFGC system permease protein LptF
LVEWREILEKIWLVLIFVACVATFFGSYTTVGVINAAVLTLILAFVLAIIGYILFEKLMD